MAAAPRDIRERTFAFAVQIIHLVLELPKTSSANVIGNQLLRSGTSIGANVEEAVAASSREDFAYKMNIALREARETSYWLRLIRESKLLEAQRLEREIQECEEIMKILGAIVSKTRGKRKAS